MMIVPFLIAFLWRFRHSLKIAARLLGMERSKTGERLIDVMPICFSDRIRRIR
jgi:hypothetical protein